MQIELAIKMIALVLQRLRHETFTLDSDLVAGQVDPAYNGTGVPQYFKPQLGH